MKISVIGMWHLGLVNCVGFAKAGYNVTGIEFDDRAALQLQKGEMPLFEPGLDDAVEKLSGKKKLTFTSRLDSIEEADVVMIAYDSPVNEKDQVDISPVVEAATAIAPMLQRDTPLVITSQIPLGTAEQIEKKVKKLNKSWESGVVYVPENLRLGQAIERFMEPDMIVMGTNNENARKVVEKLYSPFKTKKFIMNLRSAEMVKHALNTFLATSISFGNEVAFLCDALGADSMQVGMALKADARIGKAPILPGLGFAGGTLARDVTQMNVFMKQKVVDAPIIKSIMKTNNATYDYVVEKIESQLRNLKGKKIGVLGLTYKPGTSTMRRSPAIKIIQKLVKKGAKVYGFDPMADEKEVYSYRKIVERVLAPQELAKNTDILVLITEWPEFSGINWKSLALDMKKPILVDSKNFLDPEIITRAGFKYIGFGR